MICKLIPGGEILVGAALMAPKPFFTQDGEWAHFGAVMVPMLILTAHGYIDAAMARLLNPNDDVSAALVTDACTRFQDDHRNRSAAAPSCVDSRISTEELANLVFRLSLFVDQWTIRRQNCGSKNQA